MMKKRKNTRQWKKLNEKRKKREKERSKPDRSQMSADEQGGTERYGRDNKWMMRARYSPAINARERIEDKENNGGTTRNKYTK